jgi:hypothetical protein
MTRDEAYNEIMKAWGILIDVYGDSGFEDSDDKYLRRAIGYLDDLANEWRRHKARKRAQHLARQLDYLS